VTIIKKIIEKLGYPAKYSDKNNAIETIIWNDGRSLSMILHDVLFSGDDFDCLSAGEPLTNQGSGTFSLNHGFLCSCRIECSIPVAIVIDQIDSDALLSVKLELGNPAENGGIDDERLSVKLCSADICLETRNSAGSFEEALEDINRQFKSRGYIKTCCFCAFSDYHPAGHGLFGDLACFRTNRDEFVKSASKSELLRIWDKKAEVVQEIHVCQEFRMKRQ
jgi:hypothetical protein